MPDNQSKVEAESLSEHGSLSGEFGEKHRDSEGINIHYKSGANRF